MVYSPLTEVKIATQGKNLKTVTEAETHVGWPLTGLLSLLLVQIRTTYSEVAAPQYPHSCAICDGAHFLILALWEAEADQT